MTNKLLDLKNDLENDLDDSEVGRKYLFWRQDCPDDIVFVFTSTLENIGVIDKYDRSLKNKTEVLVLSDPVEAVHLTLGPLLVSRIFFMKAMWISTRNLIPIDESK
jgi:hypothetical protein